MKRFFTLTVVLAIALILSACGAEPAPTVSPVDIQSTAQAAAATIIAQTQAAMPTATSVPPTETPVPPTLTPAAVCGNGVIETGEECDTADTCGGILICGSNCKCKSPLLQITLIPPIKITLNPGIIIQP